MKSIAGIAITVANYQNVDRLRQGQQIGALLPREGLSDRYARLVTSRHATKG